MQHFSQAPIPLTGYNIVDSSRTLAVGNPQNSGNPGPYTSEMFLSVNSSDSNYNSSAASYRATSNYRRWTVIVDGIANNVASLSEAQKLNQSPDTITIPVGGSIDLGNLFDPVAGVPDLSFSWSMQNATGVGSSTTFSNEPVDYFPADTLLTNRPSRSGGDLDQLVGPPVTNTVTPPAPTATTPVGERPSWVAPGSAAVWEGWA